MTLTNPFRFRSNGLAVGVWVMLPALFLVAGLFGQDRPLYEVYLLENEPQPGEEPGDHSPWAAVPSSGDFHALGGGGPANRETHFGVGYTFDSLWIGVQCLEDNLAGIVANEGDGGRLWREDSVEIFIERESGGKVLHLIMNPIGSRWSRELSLDQWSGASLQADGSWLVELKIPFAALGGFPEEGERWGFNMARNVRAMPDPGQGSWSPLLENVYNEPWNFGQLVFMEMLAPPEQRNRIKVRPVAESEGSLIVYSKPLAGTYLREGTADTQLHYSQADYVAPKLSPDGKRILYHSLLGGTPGLWVTGRDGKDNLRLADGLQGRWSPRGDKLVFNRNGRIIELDLTLGREGEISPADWEGCSHPVYGPDGQIYFIAVRHGRQGIYRIDVEAGQSPVLVVEPEFGLLSAPAVAPDGNRIAYQDGAAIRILDIQSGETNLAAITGGVQSWPVWTEDGGGLAFLLSREFPWIQYDAYFVDLSEPDKVGLIMRDLYPSFDLAGREPGITRWTPVPEPTVKASAHAGETVLSNSWLTLSLSKDGNRIHLADGKGNNPSELKFRDACGQSPVAVDEIVLGDSVKNRIKATVIMTFPGGVKAPVELEVFAGTPGLKVTAPETVYTLSVVDDFDYTVVTDRLADDLVVSAGDDVPAAVLLPASGYYLAMKGEAEKSLLLPVTPYEGQAVVMMKGGSENQFDEMSIRPAGKPVCLAFAATDLKESWGKATVISDKGNAQLKGWKGSPRARWRITTMEQPRYSGFVGQTDDVELGGLAGVDEPSGISALLYLYGGSRHSPVSLKAPEDVILDLTGIAGGEELMKLHGISVYQVGDEWVPLVLYEQFLKSDDRIRPNRDYVFAGIEVAGPGGSQLVTHLHDDIVHILRGMDQRIRDYQQSIDRVKAAGVAMDWLPPLPENPGLRGVDSIALSREKLAGISGRLAYNQYDRDYVGFLGESRKLFKKRSDWLRQYRELLRRIRTDAGTRMLKDPGNREAYETIRSIAGDTLANRNYFKGDWRGETPVAKEDLK